MLNLILADTELELVPREIAGHPVCRAGAGRRQRGPEQTLLDSSVHHPAMRRLRDGFRRGRPDIVHIFLLTAQDSILNLDGGLRVFIHTRNGQLIRVRPDTRLPKNYNRFVSLMEQLLAGGRVPPAGDALLTCEEMTVRGLLEEISPDKVMVLSPSGKPSDLRSSFAIVRDKNVACIIGGFPDGDFTSPVYKFADEVVSISGHELKVWAVAAEAVVSFRPDMNSGKCILEHAGAKQSKAAREEE